jgi:hypothetical protein
MRCTPHLEHLEARLPPGDAMLAPALGMAWLAAVQSPPMAGVPTEPGTMIRHFEVGQSEFDAGASRRPERGAEPAIAAAGESASTPSPVLESDTIRPQARRGSISQPAPSDAPSGLASVSVAAPNGGFSQSGGAVFPASTAADELLQVVNRLFTPETQSAGVHALFDLTQPTTGPFPSNRFTVADDTQNTGRRVDLPMPDCEQRPSDCLDLSIINTLDGFNLQPRLAIPFDGPIDLRTVHSKTVFLLSLGSTLPHGGDPRGTVIGINQVVWDPATRMLVAESDALLAQHTRYALIVTSRVRDQAGDPIEPTASFRNFREELSGELAFYRDELLDALAAAEQMGVHESRIATASVFSTHSATAILEKMRDRLIAEPPAPADFLLGPGGSRTVFDFADVATVRWQQQTRTNPPGFSPTTLNLGLLETVPGSVGQLAYGKFSSPNYRDADLIIPQVGTLTGEPEVQAYNDIYFNLILPSGERPKEGWPVAIFGHGTPSDKNVIPLQTASKMAEHGVAVIAINAAGHGFGPLGTLTVNRRGGESVTFLDGGRGLDVNSDGFIGSQEGCWVGGVNLIIGDRDCKRQTVVDLMALVRTVERGMDVDGDGAPDLDARRVSYFGRSYGGIYGTVLMGVEPGLPTGVLIVGGGSRPESYRLSAINRGFLGSLLASRTPSLINPPGLSQIGGLPVGGPRFNENKPLRNQPPLVNMVAGALAIQEYIDNYEWVGLAGDPLAYAPHLRKAPLVGMPPKSVIIQFGLGDQNVPNPSTTAVIRAGDLGDRAVYYRHDLAYAEDPRRPTNSHSFQIAITDPTLREIALGAQEQIGVFFASDGKDVIHPEPRRFFEVPIAGPLPEEMNYII